MYEPLQNEACREVEERASPPYTFTWNQRPCKGNKLHEAVLTDNIEDVAKILDAEPNLVSSRFHYETNFKGHTQEGSGQSIHLAVSHGKIEISELLVKRNADLSAMVTRGGQGNYDVLHAAIWAEGRGGSDEMLRSLLQMRAQLQKNADGHFPLHKAFQIGKVSLIAMLMEEQERRNLPDLEEDSEEVPKNLKVQTPLELGIATGKMTEADLALVAPKTTRALYVLAKNEPRCIPLWLGRVPELRGSALARHITVQVLTSVFRQAPQAGNALLLAVTSKPTVENGGWHPLPSRVSFAPRTRWEYILSFVNPSQTSMAFYQEDTAWKFDSQSFKAPNWHNTIIDRTCGNPSYDAEFKVCHVPNLARPAFLKALLSADNSHNLFMFENEIVEGLIAYIWNSAAFKLCLVRLALSLWGLALLITVQSRESYEVHLEGKLKPAALLHSNATIASSHTSGVGQNVKSGKENVALAFIGARGIVCLVEYIIMIIAEYRKEFAGQKIPYFRIMVSIIVHAIFPIMMFFTESRFMLIAVVLMYWCSLLDIDLVAESMATAMLPINDMVWKLGPTLLLTVVGFMAFTHAFYIMRGGATTSSHLLIDSFNILFTGAMPSDMNEEDEFWTCLSVLVFMLFLLNIFIGVMSDEYSLAKNLVRPRFRQVLAKESLHFLMVGSSLPRVGCMNKCLPWLMALMATLTVAFPFVVSYDIYTVAHIPAWPFFTATIGITHFCAYQDSIYFEEGTERYLWLVRANTKMEDLSLDSKE